MLSMSHGVRGGLYRTSGSRMTRREQILATVLVVGLAVWCLAMYSSPGASHLQSSIKTTQQETSYGQIGTTGDVVPRRLSDANGKHFLPTSVYKHVIGCGSSCTSPSQHVRGPAGVGTL